MVITKLMGGLGNQLFQFAVGYSNAKKYNTELFLDISWFNQDIYDNNVTPRKFELDKFGLSDYILIDQGIINRILKKEKKINKLINKILGNDFVYIQEKHIEYTPVSKSNHSHLYLDGYWQSQAYFINYQNEIRNLFLNPLNKIDSQNQIILNKIRANNSISIHVRRGDYITNKNTSYFHGICTLDYYYAAINYLYSQSIIDSKTVIYIFSDDIEWVKRNLKLDMELCFVDHNDSNQSHFDLLLMSQCKHHILANSSFSWWGAFLSEAGGITIIPSKWYAGSTNDTSYMFPEGWIRLE